MLVPPCRRRRARGGRRSLTARAGEQPPLLHRHRARAPSTCSGPAAPGGSCRQLPAAADGRRPVPAPRDDRVLRAAEPPSGHARPSRAAGAAAGPSAGRSTAEASRLTDAGRPGASDAAQRRSRAESATPSPTPTVVPWCWNLTPADIHGPRRRRARAGAASRRRRCPRHREGHRATAATPGS